MPSNAPPTPSQPITVVIDGERWAVCPVRGQDCCRVSISALGEEWAQDAVIRHVELAHQGWR